MMKFDIMAKIIIILVLILVLIAINKWIDRTDQMNKNLEALLEKEWVIEIE